MTQYKDKSNLKILILGCGSIGRRHVRNLIEIGQDNLIACDPNVARLEAISHQTQTTYTDIEQAWNEHPDTVVIAAPTQAHLPLLRQSVDHGCHIFIEKPLTYELSNDLERLCAEIQSKKLVTLVGCNMRFHPGPMTIKERIENGSIGEPLAARIQCGSYLPGWHPDEDYHKNYSAHPEWGGAVLDCIHEIDLALWYLGDARLVASACCSAESIGLNTDGLAEIILRHERGALSSVHLNFVQRDYRRTCQIIGSEGTLYWDDEVAAVTRYDASGHKCETIAHTEDFNIMYINQMNHFLQAVQGRRETDNSIPASLAALRIALQVRQGGRQP